MGPPGAARRAAASSGSYSQLDFRSLLPHCPQASACNILPEPLNCLKLSAIAQTPEAGFPPTPGGATGLRWPGCRSRSVAGGEARRGKGIFSFTRFPPLRSVLPGPQARTSDSGRIRHCSAGLPSLGHLVQTCWPAQAKVPSGAAGCSCRRASGVGWLNLSRVEQPEANAWESSR